jgi:hypothetical protein
MAAKKVAPEAKSVVKAQAKPKPPAKTGSKKRASWFDEKTQTPLIEEHTRHLKGYLDAIADGIIDEREVRSQEERVVKLMKEIEPTMDDHQHAQMTQLLCELTAYDIMQMMHALQSSRPQRAFKG